MAISAHKMGSNWNRVPLGEARRNGADDPIHDWGLVKTVSVKDPPSRRDMQCGNRNP